MLHINYLNGSRCFSNFDAIRTVKLTCDVYTNDRYHILCFPSVLKFLFLITELSRLTVACDEVSELVQYLHSQQTTDNTTCLSELPGCMSGLVSSIILGMDLIML